MDNNEVFKKTKIALTKLTGLKDLEFKECFRLGGFDVSTAQYDSFKVSQDNKRYKPMPDVALESFLDGVIQYASGERTQK